MKKILISLLIVGAILPVIAQQNKDAQAVPNVTKPWTRWWWHGSAVTEKGITAALEAYQKAGLGGVEITPIYGVKGEEQRFIEYLSPAWMEKLVYTLKEAKRLGLGVDMANASGWPFGGAWVTDDGAAKYLAPKTFTLKGGTVFNDTLKFIQKPIIRMQGSAEAFDQIREEKELPLLTVVANKKETNGSFSQTLNLKDKVSNGVLRWNVPDGEWLVCAIFEGRHGKMVERAGPGGAGLAIDHFSSKAIEKYLKKFDTAFKGYDLNYLRCFFNDSYEVDDAQGEANFTPGLFSDFEKQHHYRLENYLPALLGLDNDENNRRVIYDYRTTIGTRLENFTKQWREWAKKQGKEIRNQGHGSPANVLDLYAASDIPEIEGNDPVNLKAAASAAHVTGKKLVSAETATWLNEHFESTLGDVKNAVDKMFLAGVNHIFYHGTAYSPQEAPFPGWLFYAAVHFTPQNTFWNDFETLNRYVANTQKYLQAGKPSNDILVYFPVADLWSTPAKNGVLLQHFHSDHLFDITSLKECGDYLTRHGYSWDAVSDRQLQNMKTLQGYRLLLVPQTTCMDAQTFEQLVRIAQQGVKVVFYKNMPSDVPGMTNLKQNKQKLTDLLNTADALPNMRVLNDFSDFANIADASCESFYADSLQSIRRQKDKDGYYYFIRNNGKIAFENFISLNVNFASAFIYNPMTEKSGHAKIRNTNGKNEIFLQLKPQETLLIETFDIERKETQSYPYYEVAGETIALTDYWTVDFVTGGANLPPRVSTNRLDTWTNWGEDYAAFSGTAEYKTVIPTINRKCDAWRLDLGTVDASAAVYLNGKYIRTLIDKPFTIDIPAAMFKGDDTLAIRVSNLMANRIADMDKKDIPYRIFYNTNFNARKKENTGKDGKFSAAKWQPRRSGISGTVTLTPLNFIENSKQFFPDGAPISAWFLDSNDAAAATASLKKYNVLDYGVASRPDIVQTEKLQSVIDRAAADGGGVIYLPEGVYKSGALFFRQGTHLYLAQGAVLLGSESILDFPLRITRIEGETCKYFSALLNVDSIDGFTIDGNGIVDGNGTTYWQAFWLRRQWNPKCTNKDEMRPRLLHVSNSRNVQLANVTLQNSPFWTSHFYRCEYVKIINVRYFAPSKPVRSPSTDGIDLDVCNNFLIKGCRFTVNDDAICFKGGKGPYADRDTTNGAVTNILVEDCFFDHTTGTAVTCGSEAIHVRNVLVRNCRIEGERDFLRLKMRLDTPQLFENITVENITGYCRNLMIVAGWAQFHDMKGRADIPKSYGNNITIRNINLKCEKFVEATRNDEQYELSNFIFADIIIDAANGAWDKNTIKGLELNNVTINSPNP